MSTQASTTPNQGILPDNRPRGLGTLLTPGILLLTGILVIQLLLALGMGWTGRDLRETVAGTPLMPFSTEQVARIEISQVGQDAVALDRQGEGWVLPELAGFPAADIKIEDLLSKLAGLERRLPVTTSDDALGRFKVTDDVYERKLVVTASDGATTELFFGDSPGFRRIFVRPAGETAVYEVPLAVSDISAKRDDWTDKDILKLTADELHGIRLADLELTRGDDGWQLLDASEHESLDTEKVDQLIRTVSSLSFTSIKPDSGNTPDDNQVPESIFDFQLTLDGDKTLDYRLAKTADGEFILTLSPQPHRFVISPYQAEQLLKQDRAGLSDITEPEQPSRSDAAAPMEKIDAQAPLTGDAPSPDKDAQVPR